MANTKIIMSTTESLQGYTVEKYKTIISAEKHFKYPMMTCNSKSGEGTRRTFDDHKDFFIKKRYEVLEELKDTASRLGANAVIGIKIETFKGHGEFRRDGKYQEDLNGYTGIIAYGTAVVVSRDDNRTEYNDDFDNKRILFPD